MVITADLRQPTEILDNAALREFIDFRQPVGLLQFIENFGTGRWRSREEILSYFGDFELLEPGLVPMPDWRPTVRGNRTLSGVFHLSLGGVARKK